VDSPSIAPLVADLLARMAHLDFCLMKRAPTFPDIQVGSDLDLLCSDPKAISAIAEEVWLRDSSRNRKLVLSERSETHTHVDLIDEKLVLRLDVYAKLPEFGGVRFRPELTRQILAGRRLTSFSSVVLESRVEIFEPSEPHDLLIRLAEYAAFYWVGPDKIHHVDAILKASQATRDEALSLLHDWMELPPSGQVMHEKSVQPRSKATLRARTRSIIVTGAHSQFGQKIGRSRFGSSLKPLLRKAL